MTHLLLETMKKTSCESNVEGRIVNVSSEGHRFAYREGIRFAKINDESEYATFMHFVFLFLVNFLQRNCTVLIYGSILCCTGTTPLEHMGSQSLQTFCMRMNLLGDLRCALFFS